MFQKTTGYCFKILQKRGSDIMVDEKTYHLINDYLIGNLQGAALDIFKSRLHSEKGLRQAISEQKAIIEAINAVREQELRGILKSESPKTKVIAIGPYLKTAGLAAATIAILVVVFFNIKPYITFSKDTKTAQENKAIPKQALKRPKLITEGGNLTQVDTAVEMATIDTQTLAITESDLAMDKMRELEEDDIENSADLEEYDLSENELEDVNTPKKSTAASSSTAEVVKSDKLLSTQRFVVTAISPVFKQENKDVVQDDDNLEIATRSDKVSKVKEAADGSETEKNKVANKRSISVEYWNSVVNYKGYKYSGQKVQLYGIDQKAVLKFKELDNRLYVQLKGTQYFLEQNNKYNRMVEVTNPNLLKVLNE